MVSPPLPTPCCFCLRPCQVCGGQEERGRQRRTPPAPFFLSLPNSRHPDTHSLCDWRGPQAELMCRAGAVGFCVAQGETWPTVTITRGDICQPFFSQYIVMVQRGRSATGAGKGRCLGRMARLISSLVHVALRFCRELLLCARFGTNLVRSNHPCLAPRALHQLPGEE